MTDPYAARLDPETYREDEPWGVGLVSAGKRVDWYSTMPDRDAWIPERLAERLLLLGRGYRLHILGSVVDALTQTRLDSRQAEGLVEEIEFLLRIVDDPALREHAGPMLELAVSCSRSDQLELIVDPP